MHKLYWVDSHRLRDYLYENNITPVYESRSDAAFIYDDKLRQLLSSYKIRKLFYRNNKWEY